MSSRIRSYESQRGMREETQPQSDIRERHPRPGKESRLSFRDANHSKWSDVEGNNADDCSMWPSWESSPGDKNGRRDEDFNDIRHKLPAGPAFDGRLRQHHSRPLDDSWSQPQRVRGSVQHQSRDRDDSRSRSRSRSRDRGKFRGRNSDRGEGGGQGRSRSPFLDDRHESYDNNIDRVTAPRLSARACRDFAVGNCRRGTNCGFLHQENLNSRGGRHSDSDFTERSNSRPVYGGDSRYGDNRASDDRVYDKVSDGSRRYSGRDEPGSRERSSSRPDYRGGSGYGDNRTSADRPRNKVSDGPRRYNVEDKPPVRDNMKDTFCCKEFLKGPCRWGESCRYPHHVASGNNHNRGSRNASYNHDDRGGRGPPNRSGKVPCKYFLIGTCPRENCRFSHDAPISEGVDGRSCDDRVGHIADEKNKSWNGPTWDEATPGLTNTLKSTGRRESSFHNLDPHESANYEKNAADVKNKSWDGPTWDDVNASDSSDFAKSTRQHETSVHNLNSYESTANDKHMDDKNMSWNGPSWDVASAPGLFDARKSVELGARGGHGREKNSGPVNRPSWNDKSVERNEFISPRASTDTYMGINDFIRKKKLDGNEGTPPVFDCPQSQTLDGISMPSHEKNIMLAASQTQVSESSYIYGRDNPTTFDDSNVLDVDMVSEDSTYPVLPHQVFAQSCHSMGYQSLSNIGGNELRDPTISLNPLNRPNVNLSGSVNATYPPLTQQIQTGINGNEGGQAQTSKLGVRHVMPEMSQTVVSSNQVAQVADLPAILNHISQNGQLPQIIASLNPNNGMEPVHYIPTSASVVLPVNPMCAPPSMNMQSKEQYDPQRESTNEPSGVLSSSMGKANEVPPEQSSHVSSIVATSVKLHEGGVPGEEHQKIPKSTQVLRGVSEEVKNVAENYKQEQEKNQAGKSDTRGNAEEGSVSNDEKAMRLFKIALVDFVKEILKPTWKEGGMRREVHKAVVKKAVDKVTSAVQGTQIPRTPEKIEQYMAFSKSKITKLVAAYVERLSKAADT